MLTELTDEATSPPAKEPAPPAPVIMVFDSGLGGLTVLAEIERMRPDARIVYVADNAAFPYGRLADDALVDRVLFVMDRFIDEYRPDLVVIACNTASTLVLPALRALFPMPFVGTVPAIKPAALASRSKRISVLATPGTVSRDYTQNLIETFAADCDVTLVGSRYLAACAEAELAGDGVSDAALLHELRPCFVDGKGRRTDTIVLACTHYPLLKERFDAIAPWPVAWIDPAPAIARRVVQLIGPAPSQAQPASPGGTALFTSSRDLDAHMADMLAKRGLPEQRVIDLPLQSQDG